jgi:hypothetical protein
VEIVPYFPQQEAIAMRNLLAFLAAVVIVGGGVGWYLDWFKFSSAPLNDGRRNVSIDIDPNKITNDLNKGGKKIEEMIDKDKAKEPSGDGKKLEVNANTNKVEVKTPNLDVSVPLKTLQFPQP